MAFVIGKRAENGAGFGDELDEKFIGEVDGDSFLRRARRDQYAERFRWSLGPGQQRRTNLPECRRWRTGFSQERFHPHLQCLIVPGNPAGHVRAHFLDVALFQD